MKFYVRIFGLYKKKKFKILSSMIQDFQERNNLKGLLLSVRKDVGDNIKLSNENRQLRDQIKDNEDQISRLMEEISALKRKNQEYKDEIQRQNFEIRWLKSKNQELNESHASLRKSISVRNINNNSQNYSKPKVPLKKSKSMSQPLNEDVDQLFQSINQLENSNPSPLSINSRKKKTDFEIFDHYFIENSPILNDENFTPANPIENSKSIEPSNKTKELSSETTPFFIITHDTGNETENQKNENQNDEVENDSDTKIPETKKVKKQKKVCILPSPQPIPELLKEIKSTDIDQIDQIVTRVLAESHSSITALKKRYVDILNNFAINIRSSNNINDIHQVISFFVKFSLRISPESLDLFKKSVSSNRKLTSTIQAIEETNGIF